MSQPALHIFTFKEGLLSRLAHDLRLRIERFDVQVEGGRVTASFDTRSVAVDGGMRDGTLAPGTLSARDRREIERTIAGRVLDVSNHPKAEFTASLQAEGTGVRVRGDLALRGQKQSLDALVRAEGDALRLEVVLVPSRWGIAPYRAMAGTLKLQDRVRVEVTLPIGTLNLAPAELDAITCRWQAP